MIKNFQAALGPVALDYARNLNSEEITNYANIMLIVSVLSIIITSPIGALLIMQMGPRLLHQTEPEKEGISNPVAIISVTEEEHVTNRKQPNYNTI